MGKAPKYTCRALPLYWAIPCLFFGGELWVLCYSKYESGVGRVKPQEAPIFNATTG